MNFKRSIVKNTSKELFSSSSRIEDLKPGGFPWYGHHCLVKPATDINGVHLTQYISKHRDSRLKFYTICQELLVDTESFYSLRMSHAVSFGFV